MSRIEICFDFYNFTAIILLHKRLDLSQNLVNNPTMFACCLLPKLCLKTTWADLKKMTASLMRLRSGYKATRCYYCIFTAEIDHQLSRSLCLPCLLWLQPGMPWVLSLQARMFVGNNPDQQMMHAHYNFKAPFHYWSLKQGQKL